MILPHVIPRGRGIADGFCVVTPSIVPCCRFFTDTDVKFAGSAQCCGGSFLYGRIANPFSSCR